jgi:hypothetical protein
VDNAVIVRLRQTLCLLIDPWNDDMLTVKKKLLAKSETAPFYQPNDLFMVCNGKPLFEDDVLDINNCQDDGVVVVGGSDVCRRRRHYCFREGATVLVSYRNRGGCFMVSFSILLMIGAALVGSFARADSHCVWYRFWYHCCSFYHCFVFKTCNGKKASSYKPKPLVESDHTNREYGTSGQNRRGPRLWLLPQVFTYSQPSIDYIRRQRRPRPNY